MLLDLFIPAFIGHLSQRLNIWEIPWNMILRKPLF